MVVTARVRFFGWTVAGMALGGLALQGCSADLPFPGEAMGNFRFSAQLVQNDCTRLREIADGGFSFEGILSQSPDAGTAWFTRERISRDAVFDGQVFTSTHQAPRRFEPPPLPDGGTCAPEFDVAETLQVALLSESQSRALGDACPGDVQPLLQPGGVPVDVDAGIVPPSASPEGFDAIRTCGVLIEEIRPRAECEAQPACTVVYRVEGVRAE